MTAVVPGVKKIAVLRANALGDYIFAIPALAALRAAYPQAEIVLLGVEWHRDFLQGRPGPVDRVVVVPDYPGVRGDGPGDPAEHERFFAAMAAERFDIAVQIHGGGRNSNPFIQRLGARLTAGLQTSDAPPLDRPVPYVYYQPEIARYLEAVSVLGAATAAIEPRLAVTERDMAEAQVALPNDDRPLVLIHPSASDPRRHWPVAKFAAVGDALAKRGAAVAVIGVPSERQLVDGVIDAMDAPARNLCGRLSLGGLAGLLSRSALLIANDSGPFHLAGAVGAPAVGVFWAANVITAVELFRARRRLAIAWRLNCPVCGAPLLNAAYADAACDHRESVVAEVPVDEVLGHALDLLGGALDINRARSVGSAEMA